MKKKTRRKKKKQENLVIPILILIILIGGVLLTSKNILNDIKTSISINKIKNITFAYTNKNDTTITVSNKKLADKEIINSNNKYTIQISGNKEYQIRIIPLSNDIDYKYIKLYLTDEDDNTLNDFSKPLTLSDLNEIDHSRVLYKGVSHKKERLNLRVWIDKSYKQKDSFSYKLIIK